MVMRILIATPAYDGKVHTEWVQSLIQSIGLLSRNGIAVDISFRNGMLVDMGRNALAAKVLAKKEITHLFFIDADVAWTMESIFQLIKNSDRHIVAGIYPKKVYPQAFPVKLTGEHEGDRENRLLLAEHVPMGFTLIRREVIDQMVEKLKIPMYGVGDPDGTIAPALFNYDHTASEDITFCKRWRSLGGKIHVVPGLKLSHIGHHTFTGAING